MDNTNEITGTDAVKQPEKEKRTGVSFEATKEAVARKRELRPEITESMDDFSNELNASLHRVHSGDVMDCTVVSVDEEAVTVDMDYYAPGRILPEEMSADPTFNFSTDVMPGDTFKAVVQQVDDGSGNVILSKKEADGDYAWEKLKFMMRLGTIIEGKIAEVTKSGAIMYAEGVRGFIPASKLDLKYVEDTAPYLGRTIKVQIADVDEGSRKLILSAKELLTEQALMEQEENIKKLRVGSIVDGVVDSIKDYGAFVRLKDDLQGLLHVSQICEKRINHPKALLHEGQDVTVMITKIENGKISLSMKAIEQAKEAELEEEAQEYKSEYVPNNPFAELLKNIKLD